MTQGPIRGLRFIHAAIRIQAGEIERACAAMTAPAEASDLSDAAGKFVRAVRGHAVAEDAGYFPTLAERAPGITESFAHDHQEEGHRLDELLRLVSECGTDADLAALKRATVALHEHLVHHMDKEEQLLWPRTEELFSPPEQGAMMQAILAHVPKEDFAMLLPWIVANQPPGEAEAYVGLLAKLQPPEVFARTRQWIKDGVSAELWGSLTEAVPELTAS